MRQERGGDDALAEEALHLQHVAHVQRHTVVALALPLLEVLGVPVGELAYVSIPDTRLAAVSVRSFGS
jgi:hypothetical protein